MNISNCLSPIRIRNQYTGEIMYVPCRKCSACLQARQMEMVNRLALERSKWKYSFFFTLTYAPEYCPKFIVEREGNEINFCRSEYVDNFQHGITFVDSFDPEGNLLPYCKWSDLPKSVRNDPESQKVIERAFASDNEFRVVDKRHCQLFIKRLRFHLDKYFNHAKLRYFLVSEYGCDKTENFRPHYHGLLFFDSQEFAQSAYKVLCEVWKLGFVGASFARHSASSYVAKYINGLAYYPAIYESFLAKPFSLYSKRPAIGVLEDSDPYVKEMLFNGANDITLYSKTSVSNVPLWRSIESRFFPKCREFSQISHSDRVRFYTPLSRYDFYSEGFAKDQQKDLFITDEMLADDYIARRVAHLCKLHGVSLDWYVRRIEDYYATKELLKLANFYEYQCEVADKGKDSLSQLVNCYPEAVKEFSDWFKQKMLQIDFTALGISSFAANSFDSYMLRKFDPYFKLSECEDWLDFDFSKFDLRSSTEYKSFKFRSDKKLKDGLKTKNLNSKKGII